MVTRKRSQKNKLGVFSNIMLFGNGIAILALLISYLAPSINPATFWPIAFFGIAYLPLLVVNLLFIFYWLLRKRVYMLLSLAAIAIGWGVLRDHFGFQSEPSAAVVREADSGSIRVLSYNVHLFRDFDEEGRNPLLKTEMIDLMASVSPDIVCIQEFFTRKKGKDQISEEMKTRLGLPYKYFFPVAENNYEAYGLALFSRFPIVHSGHLPDLAEGVNRVIYADLRKDDRVFRVYNVHLKSFGFQKEDYEFMKGPNKTLEEDVSSTRRIGGRLKRAFSARSAQAQSLREHSSQTESPYLIMGDFNDTPLSYAVNQVSDDLQNAFRKKGSGWGVTYNGDFPNFQIDYILASKEFTVQQFQIMKEKLSDHYPIWADLILTENN